MGKNIPAWGLDLNADPLRRSVIERARDTGQMASSSGVTLLRDGNSSVSSTLLRLASYRGGGVPGSIEERQRLYWGMVGSTVRVGELIEATLSREILSRVQLQIYDAGNAPGEGAAGGTLLFDSAASGAAATATAPAEFSGYAVTHRLAVADREWRLRIVPRKDPVDFPDKAGTAAILAASVAASVLLFWLMSSLAVAQSLGGAAQRARRGSSFEPRAARGLRGDRPAPSAPSAGNGRRAVHVRGIALRCTRRGAMGRPGRNWRNLGAERLPSAAPGASP
jgi:CHASE1-domain containing sensor protein